MVNRIRTIHFCGLNKGFGSMFHVLYTKKNNNADV